MKDLLVKSAGYEREHAPQVGGQLMIVTRIEALGFRSLRYVSQRLGPFHV